MYKKNKCNEVPDTGHNAKEPDYMNLVPVPYYHTYMRTV